MVKFNLDKALEVLEIAAKVGILGYSDKIGMGILTTIFKNIDKDACYKYINEDRHLWEEWSEERWDTMRRVSKKIKLDQVATFSIVMDIIAKNRPDLYTIFTFHPTGKDWLERQLQEFKQELEREESLEQ